ncbi:PREDICTED: uncharacterized protein LOC109237691 [Nicotiana attenuata]|uniref:uncharacterized protein LOC109237691 n=1 Tax=Nicotiana attenuata TaxID=49451 RepID=UPI000904BFA0|nr:PREDICTED: uncharacterized protein LOC109237691 [Nicotiana attenuata]
MRNKGITTFKRGSKVLRKWCTTWVLKEDERDAVEANGEKKETQYAATNQKAQKPIERVDTEELSSQSKEKQLLKGKALKEINGRPVNQLIEAAIPVRHELEILQCEDDVMTKLLPTDIVLKKETQIIHCLVVSRSQQIDCEMTIVYGYNTVEQRRDLWQQLNSKMHKGINCRAVTLIPKVFNPATIKEYMPISCCTVLYKIIAKILAGRIEKVIASIITETQSGFIPRRKVADNVIMAHELEKTYTRKHISPRWLQANQSKSAIYYGGISEESKQEIQQAIGYRQGELPFCWKTGLEEANAVAANHLGGYKHMEPDATMD